MPAEKLKELEDQQILRVLGRQKDLGFQDFSDGEFRRRGFMSDFHDSVAGSTWKGRSIAIAECGCGRAHTPTSRPVAGIVVRGPEDEAMTSHEVEFLKRHSPGDIKITCQAPISSRRFPIAKEITDKFISDRTLTATGTSCHQRSEIQALLDDGVKYIQIDAPRYSYFIDPKWRQYVHDEMGVKPDDALTEAIRADNACLEALGVRAWSSQSICAEAIIAANGMQGGYDRSRRMVSAS